MDPAGLDAVNARMKTMPTTVVSTTLAGAPDWSDATVEHGDAVDVVARLKRESDLPLRSHAVITYRPICTPDPGALPAARSVRART